MATSLIKPLNIQGGTFYAFASASKDITKTNPDTDNLKFSFSKYALLNLPSVKTPLVKNNNIQFDTLDGSILNPTNLNQPNLALAESFQNYALNFERLLLNKSDYDVTTNKTVSERVFWKWLKELGGIRFRNSTAYESVLSGFTEENTTTDGTQYYEQVVKYLGDIQITNSVQKAGEAYSEIYINIPSTEGKTPTILFKTNEDLNYKPGMIISGQDEYIVGRNSNTNHPSGLTLSAFYDFDDNISYTDPNALWMGNAGITNSYYTEPVMFDNANNVDIIKFRSDYTTTGSDVSYTRSKLDGIEIDWNEDNYTEIVNNSNINNIQEYNRSDKSTDFEFNAILIYYDMYNISDPSTKETNLFGILFLDNLTNTVNEGSYINKFKKYKQNSITKLNGNSYGLKLNYRFDSSIENASVDTVINDYESYSLNLYSDALTELKESSHSLNILRDKYNVLYEKLIDLENFNYYKSFLEENAEKITSLEQNFSNANILVGNLQSIFKSISNVSTKIDDIMNNQTPLSVNINKEMFLYGSGIKTKQIGIDGKIEISTGVQKYNNIELLELDYNPLNENIIKLLPFTNLFKETSDGFTALTHVDLFINDEFNVWDKNQVYEISLGKNINLNGFSIRIFTDKTNRQNNGSYQTLVGLINDINQSTTNKYQIICTNQFTYEFIIEKL